MKLVQLVVDRLPVVYVIPEGPVSFDPPDVRAVQFSILLFDSLIPFGFPMYIAFQDTDEIVSKEKYAEGTRVLMK